MSSVTAIITRERLKWARICGQKSEAEVAEALGVTEFQVQSWDNNPDEVMTISEAKAYAAFCGVSITSLYLPPPSRIHDDEMELEYYIGCLFSRMAENDLTWCDGPLLAATPEDMELLGQALIQAAQARREAEKLDS